MINVSANSSGEQIGGEFHKIQAALEERIRTSSSVGISVRRGRGNISCIATIWADGYNASVEFVITEFEADAVYADHIARLLVIEFAQERYLKPKGRG